MSKKGRYSSLHYFRKKWKEGGISFILAEENRYKEIMKELKQTKKEILNGNNG